MKLEGFEYVPKIRLTLTEPEINSLALSANRHYDYICRQANKQGGILFGLRNRLSCEEFDGAKVRQVEVTLDFYDVDIMAKIVERDDLPLYVELSKALRAANVEYERLNRAA
jgi:hypothetical protein